MHIVRREAYAPIIQLALELDPPLKHLPLDAGARRHSTHRTVQVGDLLLRLRGRHHGVFLLQLRHGSDPGCATERKEPKTSGSRTRRSSWTRSICNSHLKRSFWRLSWRPKGCKKSASGATLPGL